MNEPDERTPPVETVPEPEPAYGREPERAPVSVDEAEDDQLWPVPSNLEEQPRAVPPPAPPFSWPLPDESHEFHHPLDRVTGRLPRRLRIVVDWVVTIVGAVAIVLAIKAWVVNPYRIPSSSMEPTLHCARPGSYCEARFSDRVLANRFIYHFREPERGEVVVFETTPKVFAACNAGGTFVKRIIGLPGETIRIRLHRGAAFVYVDGRRLDEPYIEQNRRDIGPAKTYRVPEDHYFLMGDNRSQSCDSRMWGGIPREKLIGPVFMTYWPPNRLSFR